MDTEKVHFPLIGEPLPTLTACADDITGAWVSEIPDQVTCGRCRKMMRRYLGRQLELFATR